MKIKSAFSLFEILFVLSLFFIISTIFIPTKFIFSSFFLNNEIEQLSVICRYLQMRAMASGRQCVLTFNIKYNSYGYQISKNELVVNKLENGIKFGFIPGVMGPPSMPLKVIESPINLDKPLGTSHENSCSCINFYANGKITAGSIYFIDKQNKQMGALTCSPSQVSYMRKYNYSCNRWNSF